MHKLIKSRYPMIPEREMSKEDIDLMTSDTELMRKFLYFQETAFLNIDVEIFAKSVMKLCSNLDNNGIIFAPGDSPSKFVSLLKYFYPNRHIIQFPISGLKNYTKEYESSLKKYIQYWLDNNLDDILEDNLGNLIYIDYIDTGESLKVMEFLISEIYNADFHFSNVINLKSYIDVESIIESENTYTRFFIELHPDEIHYLRDYNINLYHEQIIGYNFFIILVIYYLKNPEQYQRMSFQFQKSYFSTYSAL